MAPPQRRRKPGQQDSGTGLHNQLKGIEMSDTTTSSSSGIGFAGLLTIAFIVLRLCGVIAWSWWWVLSPLWISALAAFAIIAVVLLVAGVVALVKR
jgi:hypothetical protein